MLMAAATYHLGLASISQPAVSSYIPSCGNMFMMLFSMTSIVADNTLLREMFPSYNSIAVYHYYSLVYFYQILRARQAANVLTRIENRVLTLLTRVGPPESWPIAAPLIGFIQSLGSFKSDNPMYSWIVPTVPTFSQNVAGGATPTYGLTGITNLEGFSRIPPVPAYQQFLNLFGHERTRFDTNGLLVPQTAALDATHQFLGIASETATTNAFQALAFSEGWNQPTEPESSFSITDIAVTQAAVRRWRVPALTGESHLNSLQLWLGFPDEGTSEWMSNLLVTASVFNRFWPGSTTLAEISPLTTIGSLTRVKYTVTPARTKQDNVWYQGRSNWKLEIHGYTNTAEGLIDTQIGITASPRAQYDSRTFPDGVRLTHIKESGPFFNDTDAPHEERKEPFITESKSNVDPTRRFPELLAPYSDNTAGRK
jgi:hypothetical protein